MSELWIFTFGLGCGSIHWCPGESGFLKHNITTFSINVINCCESRSRFRSIVCKAVSSTSNGRSTERGPALFLCTRILRNCRLHNKVGLNLVRNPGFSWLWGPCFCYDWIPFIIVGHPIIHGSLVKAQNETFNKFCISVPAVGSCSLGIGEGESSPKRNQWRAPAPGKISWGNFIEAKSKCLHLDLLFCL